MKRLKLFLSILIILCVISSGCSNKIKRDSSLDNSYNETIETLNENEEDINTKIAEKYMNVNKESLIYNIYPSQYYFYETSNGFVTTDLLSKFLNFDDKKYGETLCEYTYCPEVNPSSMPYDDAIKLVYSVLPDDINEERSMYNKTLQKTYIVYSSSKGNFVAGLTHSVVVNTNGTPTENRDIIVGIDYLKEIQD